MSHESLNQSSNEVFIIGNEILKMLQDDLFSTLQLELKSRWGDDWFSECSILDNNQSAELKTDLQFLLKQVIQKNNGNFRLALSKGIFGEMKLTKTQIESLASIQGFRNSWAHPDSDQMTLTLLRELSTEILLFYGRKTNPLVEYCSFILSFKESESDVLPKILSNSLLFRKHVGIVDGLVQGITENANLLAQITQLRGKLKKSSTQEYVGSANVPGYENFSYDSLENTLNTLGHASVSLFQTFVNLNVAIAAESMKAIGILQKTSKDRKIVQLLKEYGTEQLTELANEMNELIEMAKKNDELLTPNCLCDFCSEFQGRSLGMMHEIKRATILTTNIYNSVVKDQ
jgi:hypothetical protein